MSRSEVVAATTYLQSQNPSSFLHKKFVFCEIFPLLLGKLMIRYSGWLWPDAKTMPTAQFWEDTDPLLGVR